MLPGSSKQPPMKKIKLEKVEIEEEIVEFQSSNENEKIKKEKEGKFVAIAPAKPKKTLPIQIKIENEEIQCKICNKNYKKEASLKIHIKNKHTELPFDCDKCNVKFLTEKGLKNHKCNECKICAIFFLTNDRLQSHLRANHSKELNLELFTCDICGTKCSSKKGIKAHILEFHSKGYKKFKCKICPRSFVTRTALRVHNENHLYETCEICDKKLLQKHLKNHMKSSHGNERNFECTKCSKTFKTKTYLRSHIMTHDERRFECKICRKKFTRNEHLQNHLNLHENPNIFSCKICKKSFNQKSSLTFHKKSHQNDRIFKYKCDRCDYATDLISCMKGHQNYHINQDERRKSMPNGFECEKCDVVLKNETILRNHLKNIHSTVEFRCDLCGNAFKSKVLIYRHMEKFHSKI